MANAEYKFTNKHAEVRGWVTEVIEFAKSRVILIKHVEVFKDPDALKDIDSTHMIYDPCEAREQTAPPKDEAYESLREMFEQVFGFNE